MQVLCLPQHDSMHIISRLPVSLMLDCNRHSRLIIVAIAPLTPIAAALKLDAKDGRLGLLRLVDRVYIQGQAAAAGGGPPLAVVPSDEAYNFRIDLPSAFEVFDELQSLRLPMALLGKHAAYEVSLTKRDLESLADPCVPSLVTAARDQMQEFKRQNPDKFYSLFPVPQEFRDGCGEAAFEWFNHLPNDVVSHPYDALAVLMAEEDASSLSSPLFARVSLCDRVQTVGNNPSPAPHGVKDAHAVKVAILTLMQRAIQRARAAHHH